MGFRLFLLSILLLLSHALFAQKTTKIKIERADILRNVVQDSIKIKKLIGNVFLSQKDIKIYCDSALFYEEINKIDAFGNVKIQQGDSITATGDELFYFGNTKQAYLNGNAKLIHNNSILTTRNLTYSLKNRSGSYINGGKLVQSNSVLTSKSGVYYSKTSSAKFNDSVVLKSKDYTLYTQSLLYNSNTENTTFIAPTFIKGKDNEIYCEGGWYNAKKQNSFFKQNVQLTNPNQTIKADSLFYEENTGVGNAYSNVNLYDSTEKVRILCGYADYSRYKEIIKASQNPLMIRYFDDDSLLLKSDTLLSYTDTTKNTKHIQAWNHVKMYKSNLQGKCDSVAYSNKDSIMMMYRAPVMWSDSTQFRGDTIALRLDGGRIRNVGLRRNAHIITRHDTLMYDQITGLYITGHFKNDSLDKVFVDRNALCMYYVQDNSKAYIGVNESTCGYMWIFFKQSKIQNIKFLDSPKATFHPIQRIKPEDKIIPGVIWLPGQRPQSPEELYFKK